MSGENACSPSAYRLSQLIDKLSREADAADTLSTIHALRRAALGGKPSDILRGVQPRARDHRSRLARIRREKRALEQDVNQLKAKLARLELAVPTGDRDYSYSEVMNYICRTFRKTNGALARWAAHSAALHAADPTVGLVTESKLQAFRSENRFPGWAVVQLVSMEGIANADVPRHRWSADEVAFLERLYLEDPSRSNRELAEDCTQAFKAPIRLSGVKSKLNYLREQGRIPRARPQQD